MVNPEIILENYKNYLLTDKTCSFVIKHLCSLFNIKFRTSKVFIEDMITFIHRDNDMWSSDSGVILWAYAIEKYKLMLHTKDTYSNNVYSKISDNAIILLNINGINPQKYLDDDYLIRYLTACFYFISRHHILNSNNSWATKIRVIEFAQRCLDNLEWRYQNKSDLNKSLLATNSSNVNAVYKAKYAITLGAAPVNERMKETKKITKMISNMRNSKFTQEEKEFIVELMKSNYTIPRIIKNFKDTFNKSISRCTIYKFSQDVKRNLNEIKKQNPKFTQEEKDFIIDSRKSGMTIQDVVREFENKYGKTVSYSYVFGVTKTLNLKKSTKNMIKFTEEEKSFIIDSRKSGMSVQEVVREFENKYGKTVSYSYVFGVTKTLNLKKSTKNMIKFTEEEKDFIIDGRKSGITIKDVKRIFEQTFRKTISESMIQKLSAGMKKNKSDRRMRKNDIIIPGIDMSKFILNTQGKIKACPYNYMLFMKAFNINVHKSGSNFIVNGEKVPNIHPNDLRKRIERGMLKEDPITPLIAMIKDILSLNKNPKIEDIYAALVMCLR